MSALPSELTVQRVRHTLTRRTLEVRCTRLITPRLLSVTVGGHELDGFVSASFDDHIKIFFPESTTRPNVSALAKGTDDSLRSSARDYTPRRYDAEQQELDIEFVLHGEGPATSWAANAKPGDELNIGGPRGSFVIPYGFDWFLMAGDETALPAIARRLQESPAGTRVIVVIEVESNADKIDFQTQADATINWVVRGDRAGGLEAAVRELDLPSSTDTQGFVWAAGEAAAMRAIHQHLTQERGLDKARIRASAYWKRGRDAVHETIDG